MSVFEFCSIPKHQGTVGETRAIYEYTRLGYTVSKPLMECCAYDLIVDDHSGQLKRVSVKTSKQRTPSAKRGYNSNGYVVKLYTSGGNTKQAFTRKPTDHTAYELVFILTDDNRCWSIPTDQLACKSVVQVGTANNMFNPFELKA